MLSTIVLLGHLVVAGLIIGLVLLQRGKGAEAGTGFGAGASGTVFGARGSSSFFSRCTAVLATLFYGTSLALAYFATETQEPDSVLEGSVLDESAPAESAEAPAPSVLSSDTESELPELNVEDVPESESEPEPAPAPAPAPDQN